MTKCGCRCDVQIRIEGPSEDDQESAKLYLSLLSGTDADLDAGQLQCQGHGRTALQATWVVLGVHQLVDDQPIRAS